MIGRKAIMAMLFGLLPGLAAFGISDAAAAAGAGKGACDAAVNYVRLIDAGNYGSVGNLFATNAMYYGPDGKTRHGSQEIGDFYSEFLKALRPQLKAVSYFEQGRECLMELDNKDSQSGEYVRTAIDHFTVDPEGKISKFIVYVRPGASTQRDMDAALAKMH